MSHVRARFALVTALALLLACGGRDDRPRCGECGMYADVAPAFSAGATDAAGRARAFDAPRCLFAWWLGDAGRGATNVWITEHYSHDHLAADEVVYVVGSDVVGPMGRDLVPVRREHAERFARDHGGRVVERVAIDRALLRSLDP